MIIAIDGPAGSGKSSLSRELAKRSHFIYLDTGAMYRALTLFCLDNGIDPRNQEAVEKAIRDITITFSPEPATGLQPGSQLEAQGEPVAFEANQRVFMNGGEVTEAIRTAKVDENVSYVARHPQVRKVMVEKQRAFAKDANIIAEGRDIGTIVFPHAEVKVFLSADAKARATRRTIEREGGDPAASGASIKDEAFFEKTYADIVRRDKIDEERSESPLRPAADAKFLDTTYMTLEEAVDTVAKWVEAAQEETAQK